MQKSARAILGMIFLALAIITASLLPAVQFVGVTYADHDNGKGNGHGYGHNDDDDDNHDDDDNDNGGDSGDLIIGAEKDTYLRKIAADTNEGTNDILRLTHIGSNRALVAFDLSEVEEDEVESAILQLYIVRNENDWKEVGRIAKTIKHQTISIHALTQYWEEGNGSNEISDRNRGNGPGATWHCAVDSEIKNNKPDCKKKWQGGTFESSTDEVSIRNGMTGTWIEFDVTEDVNEFLSGEETNYGWLVKKDKENLHGAIRFGSSETDNGPRLVIAGAGDPNSPPNATDDSASTNEDTLVTFNVLSNDSDPDGDSMTATVATGPSHGSLAMTPAGSATYTPASNYNGPDSFTYAASDGATTDTATVTITISPVNDAPAADDQSLSILEGTPTTMLMSASDTDGDALTFSIVTPPQHGVWGDDDGDSDLSYTPNPGYIGSDSVAFKANDGAADSNVATISITITEIPDVNENPVAADDSATTDEGEPVTINVLGNDSDGDGDSLNVVSASDPLHGSAVINGDDTVTYTPDGTYSGTDSFTYVIEDGQGGSGSATVDIIINMVNGPPAANDDSISADEDTPATFNVLSNDSDPDGDSISIDSASTPTYGTAAIVPAGILYTPNTQYLMVGQIVVDVFTYTLTDGIVDDSATVTVTINGLNDAPVASDGAIITDEEELAEYSLIALDPDLGDTLTFDIQTEPTSGVVSLDIDGSLEYSPNVDFSGADSFVFSVSDSSGSIDTGTISVTVNPLNDPPVAIQDAAPTTPPGLPVTIAVLENDFDDDGDALEVIDVSNPAHGTAVINGDNTITYTPDHGFVGPDPFDYTISDGNGGTASAQVIVTISLGIIDAIDDATSTVMNDDVEIEVLANDIGFVEDPETANGDRISIFGNPSHGTVSINDDGTITYEPFEDFVGIDTFVYSVYLSDFSDFDTATVTVTVT